MTRYISNAFSLNMVPVHLLSRLRFEEGYEPNPAALVSVVGHADTAALLGVPCNRQTLTLDEGDILVVAQYKGPRLPEGTTVLPEGARFDWVLVTFAKEYAS